MAVRLSRPSRPKIFCYDVNNDHHILAADVLAVINYINANPGIETEASTASSLSDDTLLPSSPPTSPLNVTAVNKVPRPTLN